MAYERTDEGLKIYYTCLPGHGDADGPCGHQHMSLGTAEVCLYECIRGQAAGAGWDDIEDYGYNWMGWCVVEVHEGAEYAWERMWGTDASGDTRHIQGEPHPGWSLWQGPGPTRWWTCRSDVQGGTCRVRHRSPEAAIAHAEKENDLHSTACKRGWHRGDPNYFCMGCSGAYLDYEAVDQDLNPIEDEREED
jgi:hypothetical protein